MLFRSRGGTVTRWTSTRPQGPPCQGGTKVQTTASTRSTLAGICPHTVTHTATPRALIMTGRATWGGTQGARPRPGADEAGADGERHSPRQSFRCRIRHGAAVCTCVCVCVRVLFVRDADDCCCRARVLFFFLLCAPLSCCRAGFSCLQVQ